MTTTIRTLVVKPEGNVTDQELTGERFSDAISTAIECDYFDIVRLTHDIDLFVDDSGLINGSPLNLVATVIAHCFGANIAIFGTAVAAGTNDEGDTLPLRADQINLIRERMKTKPDPATIERLVESLQHFPGIEEMPRG